MVIAGLISGFFALIFTDYALNKGDPADVVQGIAGLVGVVCGLLTLFLVSRDSLGASFKAVLSIGIITGLWAIAPILGEIGFTWDPSGLTIVGSFWLTAVAGLALLVFLWLPRRLR